MNPAANRMIYTVSGINIDSAISLAGIFPLSAESQVDAVIRLVTTDDELADGLPLGVSYDQNRKELIATHPSVGSFSMVGGKEIRVRAKAGVPEAELANVLVTTPLAALLLQRGLVTLHASAIETDRGAIVFLGPTTTGKSCLAACFQQKGCTVLTDDLTVLSKDTNGSVWVMSGDGRLKLARGAARKWKDATREFATLRRRVRKRVLPAMGPSVAKKTLLSKIYLLETSGEEVALRGIDEKKRGQILGNNTYQAELLTRMGLWQTYRKCLINNLSTAPISVISIPRGFKQIELAGEQIALDIKPVAQPAAQP
jgi:hypothetical protein